LFAICDFGFGIYWERSFMAKSKIEESLPKLKDGLPHQAFAIVGDKDHPEMDAHLGVAGGLHCRGDCRISVAAPLDSVL
jgi:hypothetical protein